MFSLAWAVCLSFVVCFAVCFAWQTFCNLPPAWLKQLHSLGRPRKHMLSGTAVVCGGSIAGIVAARICADHFERVIIIDPEIRDSEKPKTRILQYNAGHILLYLFVEGARKLWPNFDVEMKAAGGRFGPADTQIHYSGIPLLTPYNKYPSGQFPDTLIIRRSICQKVLHRLLMQHPTSSKIIMLAGTVRGVRASQDSTSVDSVTVRELDGSHSSLQDVALVVDCTGMTQAGSKWLSTSGFELPEMIRSRYHGNISYMTLCFNVSPDLAAKLPIPAAQRKTMLVYGYVPHDEAQSSTLALIMTDNNTIQLMFADTAHRDLPRTAAEVLPFITAFQSFKTPIPSWVIEVIELLCEYGNPSFDPVKISTQSFVQYHTLPKGTLPSNFIALGDASLQLNPVHAQGFSKAIMNGIALNSLLHAVKSASLPDDFSTRYFKNSAETMEALWNATRLHDYGSPSCEPMDGETKDTGRLVRWFESKLVSAATKDEEVASALWHVRHMLAADKALLAPTVLWKILWTPSLF
ncbi:hypothetical protein MVEN_01943100 [Mycena venus]|uniref:FAD/NAD(P)-binding domain-containing protein n=1 Tax=Mycena venus TaxID=2733690 RepID=A0A8H6XGE5_9AGAR|nr:hypothetical protein MVEN_01943100 [Mycena venus]